MTTHAQFDSAFILSTGIMPKTGRPYKAVLLGTEHINPILDLQQQVFDYLTEEQKSFLLPKTDTFLRQHFDHGGMIVGIVQGDTLVAQAMLTMPTAAKPYTGMTDMALPAPLENIAVLHGVVVHPDFRGNDLMTVMTETRTRHARQNGRLHLVSEIAAANPHSWGVQLKQGLQIHSIGVDPEDGTVLYNMYAYIPDMLKNKAKDAFNAAATVAVPQADLEAQKKLMAKGYRGVTYDAPAQKIYFAKIA